MNKARSEKSAGYPASNRLSSRSSDVEQLRKLLHGTTWQEPLRSGSSRSVNKQEYPAMKQVANNEIGPARLIIADDHPLFRSALRQMLSKYSYLEVVAEAADGREALKLCRHLRPQLVLMDVHMPQMDGLTATHAIKQEFPDTAVLILTSFENPNYLMEAIKTGVAGYILKTATAPEIVEAIRKVLSGESPLSGELSALLLRRLVQERQERSPEHISTLIKPPEEQPRSDLAGLLTPQEEKVLRLLAHGQTNHQIAKELLISTSTVKKHVHRIMAKLKVSDRVQAAVRAVELGLLSE